MAKKQVQQTTLSEREVTLIHNKITSLLKTTSSLIKGSNDLQEMMNNWNSKAGNQPFPQYMLIAIERAISGADQTRRNLQSLLKESGFIDKKMSKL